MFVLAFVIPVLFFFVPQDPDSLKQVQAEENISEAGPEFRLQDLVITATRTERSVQDIPAFVDLLDEQELRLGKMVRTTPEALKGISGVMVQKTSHGQGSPFIRGFTGFRTLFMIDGIRLNNSVFRDGPNQYWNTVDPLGIRRLEMVKGPGSVLYGSDAIGGTVNALTRNPPQADQDITKNNRLYYRFSSAEKGHTGRLEFGGRLGSKLGYIIGGSLKRFGDLRGGRSVGRQRKTGYDEWDGDFKFTYDLSADSQLTLAHQQVDLEKAWRAHKTVYAESWEGTTVGNEKVRYFDQHRTLTYLNYRTKDPTSFLANLEMRVSFQEQDEMRFRIKSSDARERQGFQVGTLGAQIQAESPSSAGLFTYGVEFYQDRVDSYKKKFNADGSFSSHEIQGPVADNARYNLVGLYLQDEISLKERVDLILGARYTFAAADADRFEDPVTGLPSSLNERWGAAVGSARLLYGLDSERRWNLFAGVSQGFRAPNLSDLTRLDTARSNEIETPSPDLDPERFISYEVGIKTSQDKLSCQASLFYTDIRGMIVRTPTGNVIGGDNEVTKKNGGDGFVHGLELSGRYDLISSLSAFTGFTWMDGEVEVYPAAGSPKKEDSIDRLMPPMGTTGLRFQPDSDRYWLEGALDFAFKADKLSDRDKADTQRIPPGGTPGYAVLHFRSGWKLMQDLKLSVALENLFNDDYRIHGSGQNEPGRSLVLGVEYRF